MSNKIAAAERRDGKPYAPGPYVAEGEWQGDACPPYIPIEGQETDEWQRSRSAWHGTRQIARVMVHDSSSERDEDTGEVLATSETMATVRLFVGAPKLLEASEEALAMLTALESGHEVSDTRKTIELLRAVIARIKGGDKDHQGLR